MEIKYDVIKNQKFDIGRTINLTKCDCEKCDFLHCPKKNYVPLTKQRRYTVKEFIAYYSDVLNRSTFVCSFASDIFDDFMALFSFPKGTYWRPSCFEKGVELVVFNRRGQEVQKGSINLDSGEIYDWDMSTAQHNLSSKISKAIKEVNSFIESREGVRT